MWASDSNHHLCGCPKCSTMASRCNFVPPIREHRKSNMSVVLANKRVARQSHPRIFVFYNVLVIKLCNFNRVILVIFYCSHVDTANIYSSAIVSFLSPCSMPIVPLLPGSPGVPICLVNSYRGNFELEIWLVISILSLSQLAFSENCTFPTAWALVLTQ